MQLHGVTLSFHRQV
jgi:hypothetical protein